MFIVKLKNSFIEIFYESKKIFIVLFKVIVPIVVSDAFAIVRSLFVEPELNNLTSVES